MKQNLSKEFILVAGLTMVFGALFLTTDVRAQESGVENGTPTGICQHDPFPYDFANVNVSCDDPSCNVGPCTTSNTRDEESVCWHNPTKDNPGSYAQNTRVSCGDSSCNEGPCTNTEEVEVQQLISDPDDPECNTGPCISESEKTKEQGEILVKTTQNRIINLTLNIVAILTSVTERFDNIITRLDSRIEKLQALNVDTTSSISELDTAKVNLETAKNTISSLSSVREAVSGDSPREAFKVIKAELKSIKNLLNETHISLRSVVVLLKEAVREAELMKGISDVVSQNDQSDNRRD